MFHSPTFTAEVWKNVFAKIEEFLMYQSNGTCQSVKSWSTGSSDWCMWKKCWAKAVMCDSGINNIFVVWQCNRLLGWEHDYINCQGFFLKVTHAALSLSAFHCKKFLHQQGAVKFFLRMILIHWQLNCSFPFAFATHHVSIFCLPTPTIDPTTAAWKHIR